jgi:hypothetical protein
MCTARVGADGGVLDRPAVKISRSETANARAPSLVFDGTQYVAAWVNVPFLVGAPPLGVYGARISTAGEVRDPGGVRLSSADMNGAVALAADGLGTTLVAYDVFDPVVDAESIKGVLVSAWSDTQGPLGPYPLSWSTTGSGRGTIVGTLPDGSAAAVTCTANGSCSGIFARGTVIRLTPSASGGSVFTGWSGACAGTGACTVTMTSARAVVATFASTVPQPRASRSLVVATTAGGAVASDDGAIACGTTCTATHPAGTPVVLTAAPESDYLFAGWSGGCGGTGTCLVDAIYDQLVVARFEPTTWPVIVDVVGDGNGTVTSAAPTFSCASSQNSCSVPIANTRPATLVTLTAVAAADSVFAGWSIPCSGTGACTVRADTVRRVVARFEDRQRRLDVVVSGTGAGTVAASPIALTCAGRACSALVPRTAPATLVTLTAAPDGSSMFAGWSGSCSGTGPCAVTMDAARSVGARFETLTHRLTVDPTDLQGTVTDGSGLGLACSTDASAVCAVDVPNTAPATVVVLTMTPNTGARFGGWVGACRGTGPCELSMTGPKTVAARFDATSFPLILDLWGNGQGTVTAGAPVDLGCARAQNTCSADVANATPSVVVELAATAAEGSTFVGWTAPCSGTGTCLVTMDQLRRVAAQFVSP